MKIRNVIPKGYSAYWDEGNKNNYSWHKKGWWKRYGRKRFIKNEMRVKLYEE